MVVLHGNLVQVQSEGPEILGQVKLVERDVGFHRPRQPIIQCKTPVDLPAVLNVKAEEIVGQESLSSREKNVFTGTVNSALFIGKSRDCEVQVGSKKLKMQLPPSKEVTEGERVCLYMPPKFCIVLINSGSSMALWRASSSVLTMGAGVPVGAAS
jgi:hypothetical protein